jgi:hypothetical protein
MKRLANITSVELKTGFREKMVEKFLRKNLPPGVPKQNKINGMGFITDRYEEVEFCAAELPVQGIAEVLFATKDTGDIHRVTHPVVSRFIVFCIRKENSDYKVAWSCSLS